jgi:hypothetical protein
VAVQLGLVDDAANLYKEAGRFDLVNKLFQVLCAQGGVLRGGWGVGGQLWMEDRYASVP